MPTTFDDIHNLIFQYAGIGSRTAGYSLMRDPNIYAPWSMQFGVFKRCDICRQDTSPPAGKAVTSVAVPHNGSAVAVKEDALVVVLFLSCSFHTPSQDHRAALVAAQEKDARPTATIEVKFDRQGELGVEVGSMKGRSRRRRGSRRLMRKLTAKLAESCGSLSLTLGECQKSRAKTDMPR